MLFIEKIQDLSANYWLKNLFVSIPSITVVDAFPEALLKVPVVSIESDTIDSFVLELGNATMEQTRLWIVDVFAVNKGQRDDIGYEILNALDGGIPVYNYDLGFPPVVVPQLGCLSLLEKRLKVVRVYPELVDSMYYRCQITFSTLYEKF